MRKGYSRPFSLIMQAFFSLLGIAGLGGLSWLAWRCFQRPLLDPPIIGLYLILFGVLVGASIAGIVHMRRKDSQLWGEGYDNWRKAVLGNTPVTNIGQGGMICTVGGLLTLLTYEEAKRSGGIYHIFVGAMFFGAIQALYGLCQLALGLFRTQQAQPPGEEVDVQEVLGDVPPPDPVRMYVNLFLADTAGKGETRRILRRSDPLPIPKRFVEEVPAFSKVVDRLKCLAQLEPVICPEPREGTFDIALGRTGITVNVRADDSLPNRTLEVRMTYCDMA